MKILLIGNCHSDTLHQTLNLLLGGGVSRIDIAAFEAEPTDLKPYDFVLLQDHARLAGLIEKNRNDPRFLVFPNIVFNGYHPDMVLLKRQNGGGENVRVSGIALFAYFNGLSKEECISLYCESFVSRLNYDGMFKAAKKQFVEMLDGLGMCGHYYFDKWHMREPFMLNPGHPKLFVMADIARHLCGIKGLRPVNIDPELFVVNRGRRGDVFPTYNHEQDLDNSLVSGRAVYSLALKPYDTARFVEHCYKLIAAEEKQLVLQPARFKVFTQALADHRKAQTKVSSARNNPYAGLPPTHFWRNSVAEVAPRALAPVYAPEPVIDASAKVATAGSCFAQHISRTLTANGLNYYVAEDAPTGMSEDEAREKCYGMFSARYGNIYTARQLLQLMHMAYGSYRPQETAWIGKSGLLIDPFRPNVGDEFENLAALEAEREQHLASVRGMFETLDVFVFTLGLTESWINLGDGAVYPVAPGVVSQHRSYDNYRFHNFSHDEILADMVEFLGLLFRVNRKARVILTVSPVPLVATYEKQHVLSATTYSKSVLRSVAQRLASSFRSVRYFPSYEIITGAYSKGAYYEADLRSVKPEGVEHVMRVFMNNLVAGAMVPIPAADEDAEVDTAALMQEIKDNADVVCDENLITSNL